MLRKLLHKNYWGLVVIAMFLTSNLAIGQIAKSKEKERPSAQLLYKSAKLHDSRKKNGEKPKRIGDRALDRYNYEYNLLKNPYTGKIPEDIAKKSTVFSGRMPISKETPGNMAVPGRRNNLVGTRSGWRNRGPGNVGGRTRALAIDVEDENIIFAGGVSGGLYRSTDLGNSWRKVTRLSQSPNITFIAQDTRPGYTHIWYYASGERLGNSASEVGAFYQGTGIYQSIDNGLSFQLIEGSNDNDVTSFSPLDLVSSIAVHPVTGDLYVASFAGVFRRSAQGGGFEPIIAGGFDDWTEVMITPSGRIYVTIADITQTGPGFFYSDDLGGSFTEITPEGLPEGFTRTVMAYDPSDENRVFFFSGNLDRDIEATLFRFQADSDMAEERWVDLSANLPLFGSAAGDLLTQGAYNMLVKVHPTNPDAVFLGGTNLYRSDTGFNTPAGPETWIGGYNQMTNNFALYPNHHPDQHVLLFLPSDPNVAISANDGGVQISHNINDTEGPVSWISLNNNYLTTQPYTVSFDPNGENDELLAGFQDNGTWFTNTRNLNDPWVEEFSGDGSYNAFANNGLTRYSSAQFGFIFRLNYDEEGNFLSATSVYPESATGFDFVAPFILDPLQDNVMYLPAGNTIWRNDDLDRIPLGDFNGVSEGWNQLQETFVANGARISALDISSYPVANTLYYGTNDGQIFKLENANVNGQTPEDISTDKGLPPGNVICVYVDPTNDRRVFAVFSNYGIPSVFMSSNGGNSWRNISGNLEENSDGSGNGPSVRWFSMLGDNDGYFAATSTGLFFTRYLRGNNTVWRKISRVGNNVMAQVRTRKDGLVALAAHGNGVLSANYRVRERPEPRLRVIDQLDNIDLPISFPETLTYDLTEIFDVARRSNSQINFELTNTNPDLAIASINRNTLTVNIAPGIMGSASLGVIARFGRETVSEGFTITTMEPPLYSQVGEIVGNIPSQNFLDFGGIVQSADDFEIPFATGWEVDRVVAFGANINDPVFENATVVVYEDDNGQPGNEVYNSGSLPLTSAEDSSNLEIVLAETLILEAGTYWLSVYADLAFNPDQTQWFWQGEANSRGSGSFSRDGSDLFGTGMTEWLPSPQLFANPELDLIFQLFGFETAEDEDVPTAANKVTEAINSEKGDIAQLTELRTKVAVRAWPNPSKGQFNLNVSESTDHLVNIKVVNLAGQQVYSANGLDPQEIISWDASTVPAGIYSVTISGSNTKSNFKVVKR